MIRHDTAPTVPVVLPLVEVSIADDETITIRLDGVELIPSTRPTRANLRPQIAALAAERGTPLKVHVTEGDGRSFVDYVSPDDAATTALPGPPPSEPDVVEPQRTEPEPFELTDPDGLLVGLSGGGFLPGEPVAFAVVVTRIDADDDGAAVLRLPAAVLTRRPGPFVLFGQRSGTLVVADPFGGDQA